MKRSLLVAVGALLIGCAATTGEEEQEQEQEQGETASSAEALGTTSTPGVAEWTRRLTSTSVSLARVATDAGGNVFFAGSVATTDRGRWGQATNNITVGRYTASGTLSWRITAGDTEHQFVGGVAADAAGNVIVVGMTMGTVDLGCGPMVGTLDGYSPFVAKLSSSGACLANKIFPIASADVTPTAVSVDSSNNIVLGGNAFGDIDLGCGNRPGNFGTIWVAKLDSSFNCRFHNVYIDPTSDESYENNTSLGGLAADPNGNTYFVGSFRNQIDFGAGPVTGQGSFYDAPSEGGTFKKRRKVGFLAKLTPDGAYAWAKQLGTNADATSVTASRTRVAVGGEFSESMTLPNTSQTNTSDSPDIYVVKFDASGTDLWSRRFFGTAGQTLAGIAFDQYGYVDVAGSFQTSSTTATRTFNIGNNAFTVSNAAKKMFLTKLGNERGTTIWAKVYGSSTGHVAPAAIATTPNGRIVVDGVFDGTVDFGTGAASSSVPQSFVTKFFQ